MKKTAMVLTLALIAGSAMADGGGIVTSGGRTDGTGNMGSGCCAAASQDDGGLVGSIGGRSEDGGGSLGSGTRAQDGGYYGSGHSAAAKQQREAKRELRLFGFLIAIFD